MILIAEIILLATGLELFIAYMIIAAVFIGVGLALRQGAANSALDQNTDSPQANTVRGGMMPIVFGRRRLGATWLWVGDRQVVEEVIATVQGGKDSGGGGGKDITQKIYFESAWIGICANGAHIIHGIYRDSKKLENTSFNAGEIASGSKIDLGTDGSLYIFWGRDHGGEGLVEIQNLTGVQSKFEFCCHIFIKRYRLGASVRWGQVEIDVTRRPPTTLPTGWQNFIEYNTMPWGYGGGDAYLEFDQNGQPSTYLSTTFGWNPAYVLLNLLCNGAPEGCGIPCSRINFLSFNQAAALFLSEGLMSNCLFQQGSVSESVIGAILEDLGCFLIDVEGKLTLYPVRLPRIKTAITDANIIPPYDEIQRSHRALVPDQLIFTYSSAARDFAQDTVEIEDDSNSQEFSKRRSRKIGLTIATNAKVAWEIANRRIQENLVPVAKHTLSIMRDFKNAKIGFVFTHPTLGDIRLVSISYDSESTTVKAEFVSDFFGSGATYVPPDIIVDDADPDDEPESTLLYKPIYYKNLEISKFMLALSSQPTVAGLIYAPLIAHQSSFASRTNIFIGKTSDTLAFSNSTRLKSVAVQLLTDMNKDDFVFGETQLKTTFLDPSKRLSNVTFNRVIISVEDLVESEDSNEELLFLSNSVVAYKNSAINVDYKDNNSLYYQILIDDEIFSFSGFTTYASKTIGGVSKPISWVISGLVGGRLGTVPSNHTAGTVICLLSTEYSRSGKSTNPYIYDAGTIADYQSDLVIYSKGQSAATNGTLIPLSNSPSSDNIVNWNLIKPIAIPHESSKIGEIKLGRFFGLNIGGTPYSVSEYAASNNGSTSSSSPNYIINNYTTIEQSTRIIEPTWSGRTTNSVSGDSNNIYFENSELNVFVYYNGESMYRCSDCGTYAMSKYILDGAPTTYDDDNSKFSYWYDTVTGNPKALLAPTSAIAMSVRIREVLDYNENAGISAFTRLSSDPNYINRASISKTPKSYWYLVVKVRPYNPTSDTLLSPIIIRKEALTSVNNDRFFTLGSSAPSYTFACSNNPYVANNGSLVFVYDRLKHIQDMIKADDIMRENNYALTAAGETQNYRAARMAWLAQTAYDKANFYTDPSLLNELESSLPFIGDMAFDTNSDGKSGVWNTMWIEVWEQLIEHDLTNPLDDITIPKNVYSFENTSRLFDKTLQVGSLTDFKIRSDDPGILIYPTLTRSAYAIDEPNGLNEAKYRPNTNPINERLGTDLTFQGQVTNHAHFMPTHLVSHLPVVVPLNPISGSITGGSF